MSNTDCATSSPEHRTLTGLPVELAALKARVEVLEAEVKAMASPLKLVVGPPGEDQWGQPTRDAWLEDIEAQRDAALARAAAAEYRVLELEAQLTPPEPTPEEVCRVYFSALPEHTSRKMKWEQLMGMARTDMIAAMSAVLSRFPRRASIDPYKLEEWLAKQRVPFGTIAKNLIAALDSGELGLANDREQQVNAIMEDWRKRGVNVITGGDA